MDIRKYFTLIEETHSEAGRAVQPPLRKVAVVAIVGNPYAASGFTDDLSAAIDHSPVIAKAIADMGVAAMGDLGIESYGKGAVVGTGGEQEHGVAMLTTVYGNALREAVGGGAAWISSATKRAAPGANIDIPLAHKDALYVRSHYDAMSITLPDAPLADEIAVICCFANRGRPHHRVGGPGTADIIGQDGLR
ncbi:MAG: amino acid synthesis family protein [Pseudomonadota bacterium]